MRVPKANRRNTNRRHRCAARFTPLRGEHLEPRALLAGTASIAGTVWNDLDGDGTRGAGEQVQSGITVYLDLNDNNALDAGEPTKITAADGSYLFPNLDAGNYVVREQTPVNFQRTSPQVAGRRLFVVGGNSSTVYEVDVLSGLELNSFSGPIDHKGPYGLAFDGQTLYFMASGNNTLYKLNPNTGAVLGSTVIPGTNSDASIAVRQGKVYMLNRSGDGSLAIFDPATNTVTGSLAFQDGVGYGLEDSLGDSPATDEFVIAAYSRIDFLNAATGIQTRSFEVYGFDVDGVQTIGNEIFVTHFDTIEVYSRTGTLLRTLNVEISPGETAGFADMSGCFRITLAPGFPATNVNFGNQSVFGSIRGTRWQDANLNRLRDNGEVPLPGKTIYLDTNDNDVLDAGEPTTVTQSDGSYAFNNLAAGSYVVREVVASGFSQTYPLNATTRLFTSSYTTPSKIYELDPNTGAILNSFNAPFNGYIELAFDGAALYTISGSDTLYKINPDTGAIIASAALPSGLYDGLAAGNSVLYSETSSNTFTVIDPVTLSVTGTLNTSIYAEVLWTVGQMTNPDRLMGLNTNSQVVSYDMTTGAEIVGFTVAGASSVIYASASGPKLYVSDNNKHINVYSTASGAHLQRLNFAPDVDGLVYWVGTLGAQRITLAPGQTATGINFGVAEPSPINQRPALAAIADPVTVVKDGSATVNLVDISAGPFETQTITITATSSNPALIPNPTVNYTSPQSTGSLAFSPAAGQIGTAVITVTVNDDGGTAGGGSDTFVRTFTVIVNDAPVLDATKTPTLPTLTEDPGAPSGAVGSLVSSLVDFATPSGELDNVTDVDSGALLGLAVTAVNSSVTCYYSLNGGSTWQGFGTVSSSTSLLIAADSDNRIYCQPDLNVNGSFASALTFRAWDQTTGVDGWTANTAISGGGAAFSAATDGISLVVTPVNDAPLAANMSSGESYAEDTAKNLIDIVVSDVDSTTVTATLTISNPSAGSLNTGTSGAVTSTYSAGTGVWTASGPITNVNTLLAGLIFTPVQNFNANFTIATSFSDDLGAAVNGSKAMTGTAVNDAPTGTNLGAAETYTEDTPLNLVDIVVSDVDNATLTVRLTLSNALAGSLTTGTSGIVTSTYNAGTGVWTASGAIANVNVLLAGVTFNPTQNFNSNFSFNVSVGDGTTTVFTSKSMTGTAVIDPPTATNLNAGETYTEDTARNLIDIVASDVDSTTVTVTLTLSNVAAGSLSTATSGAVTATYDAGTGIWTASGAIADVNALLAGLTFTPALNFNANFSIATSVTDGVAAAIPGNKAVTGIAVNDLPTATNLLADETYTEDTVLNLIDIVASDVDSTTVTVTLTLSNVAAGSLSTATSGAVTSIYNAGTGAWTASGAIADVNALLAELTFTPALNFNANFSIATNVADGVAGAITGNKALTGIAVNDPPTATNLSADETYTEDTALNLIDIVASDVDSATVTVTLTLSNVAAGSLSTATSGAVTSIYNSGTGAWTVSGAIADVNALLAGLTFTPTPDFTSNLTITTSVSDGEAAHTGSKAMQGTEVNHPPSGVNDLLSSVAEDSGQRTIPFTALLSNDSTGPANEDAQTLTITQVSGALGGSVSISGSDVLFTPADNYNGPAGFTYTLEDSGTTNGAANPKTSSAAVSFSITEVNDPPGGVDNVLANIAEDSGSRTIAFAALLANDSKGPANESGQTLTITGVTSAVGGSVSIVGGDVIFVPTANYNGPASLTYALRDDGTTNGSADFKTSAATASFTIDAVNDAPSFIKGADQAVTDEDPPRIVPGWATSITKGPPTATDEAGQSLSFVVTTDNPDLFSAQPQIIQSSALYFAPKPNRAGTANISIVLKDNGGTANGGVNESVAQTFKITVTKPHVWHNTQNGLDVSGAGGVPDGFVVAGDALEIINFINAFGPQPVPTDGRGTGPYCDVNGDGSVAPNDALDVINHVNGLGGGEGERAEGSGFGVQGSGGKEQAAVGFDDLIELLAADIAFQPKRRR